MWSFEIYVFFASPRQSVHRSKPLYKTDEEALQAAREYMKQHGYTRESGYHYCAWHDYEEYP